MKRIIVLVAGLLLATVAAAENYKVDAEAVGHAPEPMPGMDMGGMEMNAQDDPSVAIPKALKAMFETPDKPLTVQPVVAHGDWAIVGWQQDGRGGRALLKIGQHGWRVHLCSGDSLRDAKALEKIGLSTEDAVGLSAKLKDAEAGIDPKLLAVFASFEGTVVMDTASTDEGHGGHEGHSQ